VGGTTLSELGRAARANAVARDLVGDEAMMARLRRMPQVQRLLSMEGARGLSERPEALQRLLRRVLLDQRLQSAIASGHVSEEMLAAALASNDSHQPTDSAQAAADGAAPPDAPADGAAATSRAERFMDLAERRRAMQAEHGAAAAEAQVRGPEDEAALSRLMALGGFGRRRALEALLACDRDEALAASLLFAQMDDADS
jgi:hypothetical protein